MTCNGCGNQAAYHIVTRVEKESLVDVCNQCGAGPASTVNDVYWPGHAHFNPQLVDNNTGAPIWLESRGHKAEVLRKKGLVEAGDRHRGAPYSPSGHWKECIK